MRFFTLQPTEGSIKLFFKIYVIIKIRMIEVGEIGRDLLNSLDFQDE